MDRADVDETLPAAAVTSSRGGASFGVGVRAGGRYRIERFVASGAMGEVYAAEDLVIGGTVALKVLRRELQGSATAIERLRREIALARKVSVHVCRLHDVGEHDGQVFLTMELLLAGVLEGARDRRGAFELATRGGAHHERRARSISWRLGSWRAPGGLHEAVWVHGARGVAAQQSRFALARALLAAKGDRDRAEELARRARHAYAAMAMGRQVAQVDSWLAKLPATK